MGSCPKCNRAVPDGRPTCMYCGNRLQALVPCRQCQRPLAANAPRCALCGAAQHPTGEMRRPSASQVTIARVETFQSAEKERAAGHFREAALLYEEIVAVDPHHSRAWLGLARSYASASDPAAGAQVLARALLALPDFDEAKALKATLEQSAARRGMTGPRPGGSLGPRPSGASFAPRPSAMAMPTVNVPPPPDSSPEPSSEQMERRAVTFMERGKFNEALAIYDVLLKQAPGFASHPSAAPAHVSRGVCLRALGRLEEALDAEDAALRCDERSAAAWRTRADVLEELGRPGDALASYERALAVDPNDERAWLLRGGVLRKLGRAEESIVSYDRALTLNPQSGEAWSHRGHALLGLQRTDEAAQSFERSLAADPKNESARSTLAWLRDKGLLDRSRPAAMPRAAAMPATADYAALARDFAGDFAAQANLVLDDSQASVYALDVALDVSVPSAASPEAFRATPELEKIIVGAGAYVGEVLRRLVGGRWVEGSSERPWPYSAGVAAGAADALCVLPFVAVEKRLKYTDERLEPFFAEMRRAAGGAPDPGEAEAWTLQGNRLADARFFEEAIECAARATSIAPNHPPALFLRGRAELELGRDGRPALNAFLAYASPSLAKDADLARAALAAYRDGPRPPPGRASGAHALLGDDQVYTLSVVAEVVPEAQLLVTGWYVDVPLAAARKWRVPSRAITPVLCHAVTRDGDVVSAIHESGAPFVGTARLSVDDLRTWGALLEAGRVASVSILSNVPFDAVVSAEVDAVNATLERRRAPARRRVVLRTYTPE